MEVPARPQPTWIPTVAGVLDIIAGAAGLVASVPVILIGLGLGNDLLPDISHDAEFPVAMAASMLVALGLLLLIGAILAIVGGFHILQRKSRIWSLIGAIAAVFCFFPVGTPAVILTVLCEKELR